MFEQNVVEIYQMIDILTDFFNDMTKQTITVGGCVGTHLLQDALDCATVYCPFKKVLVVDGCMDYVLSTLNKPIVNYLYYMDIFAECMVDGILPHDPFQPKILRPAREYRKYVDTTLFRYYECLIINNAHLIPNEYRLQLLNQFHGKIVQIVDPYDLNGEVFYNIPVVVDTLQKQTSIIALARNLIGVETRSIDKRIKCGFDQRKINKRSIGKIDDNQYVTDDIGFAEMIREKQRQSVLRKSQKLFVVSDHLYTYSDQQGGRRNIGKNALLITWSATQRPAPQYRIYGSKLTICMDSTYQPNGPNYMVYTVPANILMVEEAYHHRYQHTVFVQTQQNHMTRRYYYALLKNSMHLTVCQM